jgi:hypothetical protein
VICARVELYKLLHVWLANLKFLNDIFTLG